MKHIHVYLMFDGNCREAMTFYAKAFGAEVHFMNFADMPDAAPGAGDRVMHARIEKGSTVLMASDTMPGMASDAVPGRPFTKGDDFSISVDCESAAEVDALSAALSAGGKVTMGPQDMFWGAYFGMLVDKFGMPWMLNFDKPKA